MVIIIIIIVAGAQLQKKHKYSREDVLLALVFKTYIQSKLILT